MEERLTRYELGAIMQMHDEQHYKCVNQEHLAEQLRRMGLPPRVSRFQVAERVRELEKGLL
jgi:hypothetical protein